MFRLVTALLISLILHGFLLANLHLPMSDAQDWSITRVHLADAHVGEVKEPVPVPQIEPEISRPPEASSEQPPTPEINSEENAEVAVENQSDPVVENSPEPQSIEPGEDGAGEIGIEQVEDNGGAGEVEAEEPQASSPDSETATGDDASSPSAVDTESILAEYRREVLAAIDAQKVYPAVARRLGQEGDVRVRFQVSRDGIVSSVEVEESSGVTSLDDAAQEAVLSASPVPPIPPELNQDSLTLSLLIIFSLD